MADANPEQLRHGELRADGSARWCELHAHFHAPAAYCPHYPRQAWREIQRQRTARRPKLVEFAPADDAVLVLGDLDDDR
jgi:hypothetical protein